LGGLSIVEGLRNALVTDPQPFGHRTRRPLCAPAFDWRDEIRSAGSATRISCRRGRHLVTGRAPNSIELHPILDFGCFS